MPVQRAFDELIVALGTQFDPDLVTVFNTLYEKDPLAMLEAGRRTVAGRQVTDPDAGRPGECGAGDGRPSLGPLSADALFQQKLVDNMHDAVIFVDGDLKVACWNHGHERLTGISGTRHAANALPADGAETARRNDRPIADAECPVALVARTGVQWLRRLHVGGRAGQDVAVDAHAAPVVDAAGTVIG